MPGQTLSAPTPGTATPAPGWFGKVVTLGDFAHRRLPQNLITACDAWLAQGLSASRLQLGTRWLQVYLTGPIWCFAWAPGVVDAQWWFGTQMPSVDAVGRYFPLVVCTSSQTPPLSAASLAALGAWYAHASEAALDTLRPGATLASFEARLALAPEWRESALQPEVHESTRRRRLSLPGTPSLTQWASVLAAPLFQNDSANHSFWFTASGAAPGRDGGSLSVVRGLPAAEDFALLLEGRW